MGKILIVFVLLFLNCGVLHAQTPNCSSTIWKHVYHPDRFTIWKNCTTVTGVIMDLKKEADGDYHIQLKLDPRQPRFLNQRNMDIQKGCLVLEIVCYNKVTQADAIQPCKNCSQNITIPKKGDHVKVTGSFVKDNEGNHGWNEIHPVSVIELL
jgi:hypothetical protein